VIEAEHPSGCSIQQRASDLLQSVSQHTMDKPTLLAALDSADETVRANAALALARSGHPRALDACVATLDDAPSPAHADFTPAVFGLIEIGRPALLRLVPKLRDESAMTRLHAQRAVEGITRRRFGFDGLNWPAGGYARWADWWTGIGYQYDVPAQQRELAVARLCAEVENGRV
jgi:hypothetical protein